MLTEHLPAGQPPDRQETTCRRATTSPMYTFTGP